MKWRGFTAESKSFCGYHAKTPSQKVSWWWAYCTQALPRYWFYSARGLVYKAIAMVRR